MGGNRYESLEELADSELQKTDLEGVTDGHSAKKTFRVDTGGTITYSLIVGSILDYTAGLNLAGIGVARTLGTGINFLTGGAYGWWREKAYKTTGTTEESGRVRKTIADLLAFNTFQVPIYATAIAFGSLASEGRIDWDKVVNGSTHLAYISPLIGPTMGLYMDLFRRLFGVKAAAEWTYGKSGADSQKKQGDNREAYHQRNI